MSRYVGIDLGIATGHRAAVLDGADRRGKPFAVEVSGKGFQELLRRATEGAEGSVKIVMEPTGLAWVPVAAYMSAAGHQVYLAKPQKASQFRKFLKDHTKSDVIDADAAARLPQVDPEGVHELRLPPPEQMALAHQQHAWLTQGCWLDVGRRYLVRVAQADACGKPCGF